jgi:dihydroorotase
MHYLIKNGSIVDPAQRVATVGDVLVEDGKVVRLYDLADMQADHEIEGEVEIINARGCVVAPGFTDLHVHLRQPGEEYKETIASGTLAAAYGGFTTVCAMPNTNPAHDRAAVIRQVRRLVQREAHINVEIVGAITLDRAGQTLTEMSELLENGCFAFSDDNNPVADPAMMRNALAYAARLGVPIFAHCEDLRLNVGWAMHEGVVSTRLGLPGYPAAAEEAQIARDISLAELTGAHLHICHVSTAGGVSLIRNARRRGINITAAVTPHHLTMDDRWVLGSLAGYDREETAEQAEYAHSRSQALGLRSWLDPRLLPPFDPSTRVNPPLRSEEDLEALLEGLRDGTIDAISTDHAPHARVEKECEYALAAPGVSGLETALGLVMTLVHRGEMDLVNTVAKLTEGPAQVLGRSPATLRPGARADIVIFDPERTWTVDTAAFVSKGHNNPLHGQMLKGQVMLTMSGGTIVFRREGFGKQI